MKLSVNYSPEPMTCASHLWLGRGGVVIADICGLWVCYSAEEKTQAQIEFDRDRGETGMRRWHGPSKRRIAPKNFYNRHCPALIGGLNGITFRRGLEGLG
jgi:hypothetical protein